MANKLKPALKIAVEKTGAYKSIQEQQELKNEYYSEAIRYMDNAKEYLKQAKKDGNIYRDAKYVRTACGTAYNGVLIGLEGYLIMKGYDTDKKKVRKSVEYYQNCLAKLDRKMMDHLNSAYKILHLYGYYDGLDDVRVVNAGFEDAKTIIDKIKPAGLNGSANRNGKVKKIKFEQS